jgi:AraC family transcriptional regulator
MEPVTILEKGQIVLAGFSFFGDPFSASAEWTEENEIGRVWNRFFAYLSARQHHIPNAVNQQLAYEVHIEHDETQTTGFYEVFVGFEVERVANLPVELLVKVLPPTTYAVFLLKGQEIVSDWTKGIQNWMAQAGYESAYRYGFELYDHRFKGMDRIDESELDAYIPVKKREP